MTDKKKIYIIGALKNENITKIASSLRPKYDVFDQWITPGPEADHFLFQYAKQRGWNYKEALTCDAAKNNFNFDKRHIDSSDIVVMVMPAGRRCFASSNLFEGKSAHLELGYSIGIGHLFIKPSLINKLTLSGVKKPIFYLMKNQIDLI